MLFDPKYDQFIVRDFRHWRLYLHDNQRYLGRMYVAALTNSYSELADMPDGDHRDEFFFILRVVRKVLNKAFEPKLLNYCWLRNQWQYAHMHIIPRYEKPVTFADHTFEDIRWDNSPDLDNNEPLLDPVVHRALLARIRDLTTLALFP